MNKEINFVDILKTSWGVFLEKFWRLSLLGALFLFPSALIVNIWIFHNMSIFHSHNFIILLGILLKNYPWIFLMSIVSIFLNLSIIYVLNNDTKKKPINFTKALRGGWNFYGKGLLLGLLLFIFLIPLYSLFIIPGIIFQIYWTFAFYVLVAEKTSAMDAIKKSYKLVNRRWWKTLIFVLGISVITSVINSLFTISSYMFSVFLKSAVSTFTGIFLLVFLNSFYLKLKKKKA